VKVLFSVDIYLRKEHVKKNAGPRVLPDVSFTVIALERIICMDAEQHNQAEMRGFVEPEAPKVEQAPRPKPEEEEEAEEEDNMDEDAVVDLLIQQHRLQEQAEREGEEKNDEEALLVLPPEATEADLEKIRLALEDADSLENLEEEEAPKEEVKVEEKKESIVDEEIEEKDEFDLAIEETLAEAAARKFGEEGPTDSTDSFIRKSDISARGTEVDEGLLQVVTKEGPAGSIQPIGDDVHLLQVEVLPVGGMRETFTAAVPVKIAEDDSQPSQAHDPPYVPDLKYSIDVIDEEEELLPPEKIHCEWDKRMERTAEMIQELEEEKAGEEVIEEEKLDLPSATDEDDLTAAAPKPQKNEVRQTAEFTLGFTMPEMAPPTPRAREGADQEGGNQEEDVSEEPRPSVVPADKDEKAEPEEVEEFDDISDISHVDEDSRLSDHKGLEDTEISSTSSEEEDLIASFREMVHRRSSANKVLGMSRFDLDDDICIISYNIITTELILFYRIIIEFYFF